MCQKIWHESRNDTNEGEIREEPKKTFEFQSTFFDLEVRDSEMSVNIIGLDYLWGQIMVNSIPMQTKTLLSILYQNSLPKGSGNPNHY